MHLIRRIVVIIAGLAALASLVSAEAPESSGKHSIVGTWQVLRHGADCDTGDPLGPDFKVLMTFDRGGTLNAFGIPPDGTTPANTSPEYGNWTRVGSSLNYTFRDVSYGYDENGAFNGRGELTATLTLAADGNSFTQDTVISVYDANGNFLFSFCGKATGTRFE